MRHWPLNALEITTADLTLRLPTDAELDTLAHVAAQGVHPPDVVRFPQPWASGPPEQRARNVLQNHWWARGDWAEDNWRLLLAVFHHGQVIGQQNLSARHFTTTREARTGFWLGEAFQGRGFGTQMRAAILHLAFEDLEAERVTSTAFADNFASRRVSEKLGYTDNGMHRIDVGGRLVEVHEAQLGVQQWRTQKRPSVRVSAFDGCRSMFGAAQPSAGR